MSRPYICNRCIRSVSRQQHRSLSTAQYVPPHASIPGLLTLTPSNLNSYKDTPPPSLAQTSYASQYFTSQSPQFLFSTAYFRSFPPSTAPEITFLGRSNVGKSSLLNALFNRPNSKLAYVSKRPGRTKVMNVFGIGGAKKGSEARNFIGRGGLCVVDCPGYGFASREEWGKEVVKYLQGRKQLRRAFLLVDAEHGVKSTDEHILELLREAGTPHQIILSKVDKILYPRAKKPTPEKLHDNILRLRAICEEVRTRVQPTGNRNSIVLSDILCCSSEKSVDRGRKMGLDELRWALLQAAGSESTESGKKREVDKGLLEKTVGEDGIYAWGD
ncbi:hypothetical protein EJ08DRAFT_581919 [Tothia fuscella]|uniref:GTP-binding protein 8 n=1 Tax=Tothia fuscella TaxID=1048955 RepID=A0A9P4P0T5_9PEZI|nr:hypothetical protein EJ08DRAFT_581919 [Tothia fuscella]